jgi:hypothetical protein
MTRFITSATTIPTAMPPATSTRNSPPACHTVKAVPATAATAVW